MAGGFVKIVSNGLALTAGTPHGLFPTARSCVENARFWPPGLAFSSVVNFRKLLKAHVQTSKICLLLLLNLLKSTTDLLQICVYDRVECRSRYFSMPHLCSSSIFRRTFPRALASDRGSTIPMFISRLTSTWLGTNQSCNCFVMICAMPIYWLLSCVMHLVFQCLNTSILSQISRCVPIASFAWFSWFILY